MRIRQFQTKSLQHIVLRCFLMLSLAFLFLAVACGPGGNGDCKEDKDCAAEQACKSGKCVKKEASGCKEDSECGTNEECKDGECKTKASSGCKEDSECGTNEECKSEKCVPKEASGCKEDSECGANEECKNGTCTPKQTSGCQGDGDCKPDETCSNGACRPKEPQGCQGDGDCAATEVCDNGACKPKSTGCKTDAECGDGKECKNGTCVNKPGPGCSSCGLDEFCFNNDRCVKKPKDCTRNEDCGSDGVCIRAGTKQFCLTKCDPTQNSSKEDRSNASCWAKWGWCLGVSQTDPKAGACVPPQSKTRKKGEACGKFDMFDKPDYNDCEGDLQCSSGKCADGCDPSKGRATNSKCPTGQYCSGSGTTGLCRDLPAKKEGTKKEGEECSNSTKEKFCDGNAGLVCQFPKCVKACDPRKGTTSNPACGSGECVEQTSYSHLGGVCVPKASQKDGESCNRTDKRCVAGLKCAWNKCAKECDDKQPQPGGCAATQWCYGLYDVCTNKCDPAKGVTSNADCGKGFRCVKASTGTYKPGYCRPLPDFKQGSAGAGAACSSFDSSKYCDGSKQLFCYLSKCFKACDFGKGATNNPDCGGDDCKESTTSPLGGVCLPKANQQIGQECNSTNKRCAAGLNCDSGRCAKGCDGTKPQPGGCGNDEWCYKTTNACRKKCDPANGVIGNSACGAGGYCVASSTTYKPGYCRSLPAKKTGTKQLGEDCSNFTSSRFCDGSKDLVCYSTALKCFKGCDPTKGKANNPNCGANDECKDYPNYSHLGGICEPKPTQKVDEECDASTKKCVTGLTCVNFGTKGACQKDCDPSKTGECPAGTKCETLTGGAGVCIKERQKVRQLHEKCGGAPGSPAFEDCDAQFICAGVRGSDSHCLAKCDPKNPQCPGSFVCLPLSGGSGGVCGQKCTDKSQCTSYGTECRALGSNKVCL